jgi:hypothetical protein
MTALLLGLLMTSSNHSLLFRPSRPYKSHEHTQLEREQIQLCKKAILKARNGLDLSMLLINSPTYSKLSPNKLKLRKETTSGYNKPQQ